MPFQTASLQLLSPGSYNLAAADVRAASDILPADVPLLPVFLLLLTSLPLLTGPMLTNVLANEDVLYLLLIPCCCLFLAVANIVAVAGVLAAAEDVTRLFLTCLLLQTVPLT
jgi:hypothetical protein